MNEIQRKSITEAAELLIKLLEADQVYGCWLIVAEAAPAGTTTVNCAGFNSMFEACGMLQHIQLANLAKQPGPPKN